MNTLKLFVGLVWASALSSLVLIIKTQTLISTSLIKCGTSMLFIYLLIFYFSLVFAVISTLALILKKGEIKPIVK